MSEKTHLVQRSVSNSMQEDIIWGKYENRVCRQSLLSPSISSWFVPFSKSNFSAEDQTCMTVRSSQPLMDLYSINLALSTWLCFDICSIPWQRAPHLKMFWIEKALSFVHFKPLFASLGAPNMREIILCPFSPHKLQFHAPPVSSLLLPDKYFSWTSSLFLWKLSLTILVTHSQYLFKFYHGLWAGAMKTAFRIQAADVLWMYSTADELLFSSLLFS